MEISKLHEKFLETSGVSIDTRKIFSNSIFFALKGESFNGNLFAEKALQLGAKYVVVDDPKFVKSENYILVNSVLEALQQLATYHRNYLGIPIIGLTGSNGKTTTKELVNVVLSTKYKTTATIGNLNNHIGVPLTLLSMTQDTEIGIVEMGANHQKEIEFLCSIAKPDYGYITNFGKAHLEGFGGVEGVIKGKSELYTYLKDNNKKVFINLDDPIQLERGKGLNSISFGLLKDEAFLNVTSIIANPFVSICFDDIIVKSNLIGLYNAYNINAAIAMGKLFGVSNEQIKLGIESYVPTNNRSQLLNKKDYKIILDAYNANPSSMKAALDNFFQLDKSSKTAILGDMFELGSESISEHKKLIDICSGQSSIVFYFIGKEFFASKIEQKNLYFFESFETFKEKLELLSIEKGLLLIKGSRGMSLERILDIL